MVKTICFEGINGAGKGRIIQKFNELLSPKGDIVVVKDSDGPEFIELRKQAREGLIPFQNLPRETLKIRKEIYEKYLSKLEKNMAKLYMIEDFILVLYYNQELSKN